MSGSVRFWVVPLMRIGYLARAIVYGLIGFLAARAAWLGGHAKGAEGALVTLIDERYGIPLLWAIAVGAFCYAAWSLLAAVLDLDGRGTDLRGIVERLDLTVTGLAYIAIGILVADLAERGYAADDGESRERGTAWLLSLPAGGWVVVGAGVGFIAVGLWFGYKGFAGIYRRRLSDTPMVDLLSPVCKFGWTAYGIVIAILGCFLIWAGWTMDPSRAGGFAEAFAVIRQAAFGRILLLVVGLGFVAFAAECVVEAAYRVVPAPRPT